MIDHILRMVLSAALLLAASSGRAEETGGAGTIYPKAQYPYGDLTKQPLTLAAGIIELNFPVEFNLTQDLEGQPWNIPAALDFGVTDDLQIGLFHTTGVCLAGEDRGCPNVYDDIGGRVRFGLHRDPGGQLALQGGAYVESFDAGTYNAFVGAAYKRTLGNLALVLDLNFDFALNDRDQRVLTDALEAQAELQLQLMPGLAAYGFIGYGADLEDLSIYVIPVGFGAEWEIFPRVGLGAEFTFDDLLGEDGTADVRTGVVYARLFL